MRIAATLLCLMALSACEGVFPYAEVDVLTIVATDKSIPDHVISFYTGKDCSTVRYQGGRTYCLEDEPNPNPSAGLYCYSELGSVTCYDRPKANGLGYQEVGQGNGPGAMSQ